MSSPPPADAPTRVRYLVVFLATLMAVLLYLDRFCISLAERYIKEDLNLSEDQISLFLSMFFWTYALAQVPSGWLSDRYGARLMLPLYILGWSLFTGLTGAVQGFFLLLLMRALFGLTQSGAYPTAGSLLSKWMPVTARGTASGIVSFGGRIGGALAPLLTGLLIVLFVPADESSQLAPRDVLNDHTFSRLLLNQPAPDPKQPDALLLSGPDADLRDHLRTRLAADWPERLSEAAADPQQTLDDAERGRLVEELNAVIASSELFPDELLDALPLPPEAKRLRGREDELTANERERLQRLVLEIAFPGGIRQIYGEGWRPVMYIYGFVGLFVAGAFWYFYRDTPAQHPSCNDAERALIRGHVAAEGAGTQVAGAIPWGRILKSFSIWCDCIVQIGTNVGWTFIVTWLPRYLSEVHQAPLIDRALMTSLPMIFGIAGNFAGGWLTDWAVTRWGLRWGRACPIAFTRFLCAGAFLLCLWADSAWAVTGLMCVMAFGTDLGTASIWAFCQDVGGRFVGSILGWGNMWGNLGAAVSPILLNEVIKHFSWDAMFLTCAASFAIVGFLAFGINAEEQID